MNTKEDKMHVGGQAVIEGVMMRSPEAVSVAVRKTDGKIVYQKRPFISFSKKSKLGGLPIIRGAIILIESLVLGMQALSFSSEVAIEEENEKHSDTKRKKATNKDGNFGQKLLMTITFIMAIGIGLALFFYLPLTLTHFLGLESGILFNFIDGIIRLIIFLLYIYTISMWKEIKRVFEYHGAEHKSIKAFENKEELTVEAAQKYTTMHPRCGTSFLLVVVIVSIFVFVFLGKPSSPVDPVVLARLALVPLIAGLSYEVTRFSDRNQKNPFFKLIIAPGLWLQKITTREPDDQQIEVAYIALKTALGEDVSQLAEAYTQSS